MPKMSTLMFAGVFLLAVSTAAPRAFAGTISAPATPNPWANPDPPGDLVVNGSFQTGDFTGWTATNNDLNTAVVVNGNFGYNSQDASDAFFAALGTVGHDVNISQSLTDVAGQAY